MNNFDLRKFFKKQYLAESGFRAYDESAMNDEKEDIKDVDGNYLNPELIKYQGKKSWKLDHQHL